MGYKIGLDAGHGLNTAGKETPDKIKEWSLNDKVRDKVVAFLSEYDCEIIHTDNDEGVTDESLSYRTNKYLNAGVDLFVSIHHNAYTSKWNSATGVGVYIDKKYSDADKRLAECIYKRMVEYTGLRGRGINKENFWVINQNKIPAVLVEGGFMDGTNDYKVITTDEGQTAYAKAVAEGIIEFLGLVKKTEVQPTTKPTVTYQVYAGGKWWGEITGYNNVNTNGYAGVMGKEISGIRVRLSNGKTVTVRSHIKGKLRKSWLSEITKWDDSSMGYSGIFGKAIDCVTLKADGHTLRYRVHTKGGKWLEWICKSDINDYQNGLAGIYGKSIDAIQIDVI